MCGNTHVHIVQAQTYISYASVVVPAHSALAHAQRPCLTTLKPPTEPEGKQNIHTDGPHTTDKPVVMPALSAGEPLMVDSTSRCLLTGSLAISSPTPCSSPSLLTRKSWYSLWRAQHTGGQRKVLQNHEAKHEQGNYRQTLRQAHKREKTGANKNNDDTTQNPKTVASTHEGGMMRVYGSPRSPSMSLISLYACCPLPLA